MQRARGKILIIRGGAIGDFILTLPAIAALRQQFPDAHLEVLGYPHIIQLAQAGGLVDRVQSIEARALAGFFARHGDLAGDLVDYFSEFDIILSYLYDPDDIFKTNIARCSPAQFVVGPYRPNEMEKVHATKVYLRPLERFAIFEADHLPRLSLNSQPASVKQIALHPGSGSEKKNWPEAKWANLLQHLVQSTDYNLLLIGGEAEGERLQRLAAALPITRTRVAQSLPLTELAWMMQPSAAFVGHDTGISHLAGALGLPGVVLWGNTAEEIWRPPHQQIVVLKNPGGIKTITVEEVTENLEWILRSKTK
ncbi:MAG TPA: glycosyltransferase family 9 protein [Candidatus Polarisedimenticolia bacterium]|nr:glycosyltransferase family 9 protein [Candidatus Polarisedimenticolia bacterium]